jgi:hypothetical protein
MSRDVARQADETTHVPGARLMATPAQIAANCRNAKKSTGPKDTTRTRFNGLKHGLRAEQIVLPGEDPAEFEAEKQAFLDDWEPQSHTRAVLVERAALASWRLRRCARVEAARLRKLAANAAKKFDAANEALEARARERFKTDAAGGLAMLEADPYGLDRLIHWWGELDSALADGPAGWDGRALHGQMTALLGLDDDAEAGEHAPIVAASLRLLAMNEPEDAPGTAPFAPREAKQAVAALRSLFARVVDGLRRRRARFAPTATLRCRAIDEALVDDSAEGRLLHRYEMTHDRVLRATLKELRDLDRSGADLAGEADESSQDEAPTSVASDQADAPTEANLPEATAPTEANPPGPDVPDAPTGVNVGPHPAPATKADRDREGRVWPVEAAGEVSTPRLDQ